MHYYQHHIGDYRKDTGHLSLLEHGVYRQMIDLYYTDEKPLSTEMRKLYRALSAKNSEEREAVENVLADFFQLTESGYIHKRCDKELARIYNKSEQARASVRKRWDEHTNVKKKHTDVKKTHTRGDTDAILPINPLTHNKNTCAKFDLFWSVYPVKVGKKSCLKKWKLRKLDSKAEMIVEDVTRRVKEDRRWKDGFIPNPLTYINGDRWEDEQQVATTKPQRVAL